MFPIVYIGWTTYTDYLLLTGIKRTEGIRRNQIKYFLAASMFGRWGGVTTFPLVFNITIPPLGLCLMPFYGVLVAYGIFKYRLMDINIAFKKSTVYVILTSLALVPCMLIIVFAQKSFFGEVNYAFSCLVFGLLLLAAILFTKIKARTEESVERTLFRKKYEYKRLLREFSKRLVSYLDEQDLLNNITHTLTEVLGIEKMSFLVLDKEKKIYRIRASKNVDSHKITELSFPQNDPFFEWLKIRREIAVREVLERTIDNPNINPIIERLKLMESEVCIPLFIRDELAGIINLGGKRSGDMYSHEDIELLNNLASQTAIALENSRLYEELKRSKTLIRRADKLASLGTLTAGLAHEIKNPLVAIKTFIQLLPERFEDEEFRNYFLNVASGEVDRLSDLVNALLDFSRPSQPSFQTGNVNEIMDSVVLLLENEVKRKNIKIKRRYSSDLPAVMLDPEQIKQVFLNIMLNAAEATPENGVLTVETRHLDKDRGQEFIQVEIRDTGRGIPKDNLERIFEPFFTTKDSGSGLGLAVSHHIVQEHQGYIEVESEVGMGTSFYINLPVNPLVMPRKEERDRFWSLI
ncbi:MAG TPA: GAF domain-containing protein [Syntrophaceae bacterium]|nr:GAF domain-containing protein [Syntrophaceae bacterium]